MSTTDGVLSMISDGDADVTEATEAFFKKFVKPEDADPQLSDDTKKEDRQPPRQSDDGKPAPKPSDESPEDKDDDKSEEEAEDQDKTEDKPKKTYVEDDEALFKVKVGDEEHEVPAKDLRRLYGQEAALTRRSQEVAKQRETLDAELSKTSAVLQRMHKMAQDAAAPYKNFNWMAAAKDLSTEELTYISQQAQQTFAQEKFIATELDSFYKDVQKQQTELMEKAADKAWSQLQDPADPNHVPDWNDKLYEEICEFAVQNGLAKQVVDQLVDAPVFKLLHQAMMYQKGASKVIETKKTSKEPKRIIKTTHSPDPKTVREDKTDKAMAKFKATGSYEDAGEALLARWAANSPVE